MPAERALRTGSAVLGALVLLQVAVLAVLEAVDRRVLPLPVLLQLPGRALGAEARPVPIAVLDGGVAALVPAGLLGVALLVRAVPARAEQDVQALTRGLHGARWLLVGLVAPITLVVVARLNGVADAGAIVLVYAATTGGVLLRALQERVRVTTGPAELPLWFAAMLGIVPWGVIALHQVGGGLTGGGPPIAVRVLTVLVLVASIVEFVGAWREQRRDLAQEAHPVRLDLEQVVLVALPPLLLAWIAGTAL